MIKILLVIGCLFIQSQVWANCTYKKQVYSEGKTRGPYICIDTKWELRESGTCQNCRPSPFAGITRFIKTTYDSIVSLWKTPTPSSSTSTIQNTTATVSGNCEYNGKTYLPGEIMPRAGGPYICIDGKRVRR